jgi:hypothetical protein
VSTPLLWINFDYGPGLKSDPFSLIKRRKDGKIFWIARVELESRKLMNRSYAVVVYGVTLREAKKACQKLVDAWGGATVWYYKGEKVAK